MIARDYAGDDLTKMLGIRSCEITAVDVEEDDESSEARSLVALEEGVAPRNREQQGHS